MSSHTATYQGRLILTPQQEAFLTGYAEHYNHVERLLYADMCRKGSPAASFKKDYLIEHGISARQFNAIGRNLEGKISSVMELLPLHKQETLSRIAQLEKTIKKTKNEFKLHQKKRKLFNQRKKFERIEQQIEAHEARICFGSRALFRKQFNLESNGYISHEDWKKDWEAKRNSQFFILGSGDETTGNQGCTATVNPDGTFNLKIRSLSKVATYLEIKNISIPYGQQVIQAAIDQHALLLVQQKQAASDRRVAVKAGYVAEKQKKPLGPALSYRFLRDGKGWRIFITTEVPETKKVSIKHSGTIGVDINADCLAVTEIDRFGNIVKTQILQLVTYGKSTDQAEAIIGDTVKELIEIAVKAQKPIIIENLKFAKKKAELEGESKKYARMLSSFAYNRIVQNIKSRAHRLGIEIREINPAYTSTIGLVNYTKKLGISTHQAAAYAIARRGGGFRENPSVKKETTFPTSKGDHVTFCLPVRNRKKHVWSFWADVKKDTTAVLAAHFRPPDNGEPEESIRTGATKKASNKPPKSKCPEFTVRSRDVNRQQHCSAGVIDDIPW